MRPCCGLLTGLARKSIDSACSSERRCLLLSGSLAPGLGFSLGVSVIYFLHHFDRSNQGDILSGPYRYFDFPEREQISWDNDILQPSEVSVTGKDVVVMGGGIYFTANKARLMKIIKASGLFVGWGLGLDPRAEPEIFTRNYDLLGTRERKSPLIDNEKIFYVPCASCMHDAFDAAAEAVGAPAADVPAGKIALHVNGGFNCHEILRALSVSQVPTTRTVDPFEKIIENLKGADCIVTNSYHGAYWGSLLGKRVVCIKTGVPKWDGLSEDIVFAGVKGLDKSIEKARPVSADYLKECRLLNQQFYERLKELMKKKGLV